MNRKLYYNILFIDMHYTILSIFSFNDKVKSYLLSYNTTMKFKKQIGGIFC